MKGGPALYDGWANQIIKNSSLKDDFLMSNSDEYTSAPKN
jgi:hypothetical protein